MRALHSLVLVAAALSLSGCAEEKGPLAVPVPDQMIFEAQI
jgi:predicted small lipoprotein YifL